MEGFTKKTLEDVYIMGMMDASNLGIFLGLSWMESSPLEIHGCPVDVPFMCWWNNKVRYDRDWLGKSPCKPNHILRMVFRSQCYGEVVFGTPDHTSTTGLETILIIKEKYGNMWHNRSLYHLTNKNDQNASVQKWEVGISKKKRQIMLKLENKACTAMGWAGVPCSEENTRGL